MSILSINDKVGIVANSNGQPKTNESQINNLISVLKSIGLVPVCSEYIYVTTPPFNGNAEDKGNAFIHLYQNPDNQHIFKCDF